MPGEDWARGGVEVGLLLEEHPAALPFVFTMRLSAGHGHKSLTM